MNSQKTALALMLFIWYYSRSALDAVVWKSWGRWRECNTSECTEYMHKVEDGWQQNTVSTNGQSILQRKKHKKMSTNGQIYTSDNWFPGMCQVQVINISNTGALYSVHQKQARPSYWYLCIDLKLKRRIRHKKVWPKNMSLCWKPLMGLFWQSATQRALQIKSIGLGRARSLTLFGASSQLKHCSGKNVVLYETWIIH